MASLPTHLPNGQRTLIRDAVMAEPARTRERTARVLQQLYGASPHWPAFQQALASVLDAFVVSDRTAAVAEASTRALLDLLTWKGQTLRSSDLPARPGRSQRLADLATGVSARTYLCGSGGMRYLDVRPFVASGITVTPFNASVAGLCEAAHQISAVRALMQFGPHHLVDELRTKLQRWSDTCDERLVVSPKGPQ
ncbi:WbqC family protein [Streptomyces sp. NPDC001678]|uniref:WbqC family protein n=1 Tax=Streptomyces sp. NPDC001678 TaxID=3364599 RepID=UPI0036958A8A